MAPANPIFEKNYIGYLERLAAVDFALLPSTLDITVDEARRTAHIPFFKGIYHVSPSGVVDSDGNRPGYDTCVILLKYLLMCPMQMPLEKDWVNFRDLKTSGYTQQASLGDYAIQSIARYYSGNKSRLEKAVEALNGIQPQADYPYDVSVQIAVLPRIPILFLYNDAEAHAPAQAFVLFERRAEHFLDAECLAMVGSALFAQLKRAEASHG